MSLSFADRVALTRQIQARQLDGPSSGAESAKPRQESGEGDQRRVTQAELLGQEFRHLLEAVAHHHQYGEEDKASLQALLTQRTPSSEAEVLRVIAQWRLDVVVGGLDGLLPAEVAQRCRIFYRQKVMGETRDENGEPYRLDALELRAGPGLRA